MLSLFLQTYPSHRTVVRLLPFWLLSDTFHSPWTQAVSFRVRKIQRHALTRISRFHTRRGKSNANASWKPRPVKETSYRTLYMRITWTVCFCLVFLRITPVAEINVAMCVKSMSTIGTCLI